MQESFNINYNKYQENLSRSLKAIRELEYFHDVTLACDDGEINAHKLLLYAGSELFEKMLPRFKNPNPFIYLKGLKIRDLESILSFVYFGEVKLQTEDLTNVLNVAKDLKIRGFSDMFDYEPNPKTDDDTSKVSKNLDDLLNTISEAMGSYKEDSSFISTDGDTEDKDEKILHSKEESEDIDAQVLDLMERTVTDEGKVSWNCAKCDYRSNDKTRTRRHVRSIHLRSDSLKPELEVEDLEALEQMSRELSEEGKVRWSCQTCQFSSSDKSRTRRHVKAKHIKKPEDDDEADLSLDLSVSKVELDEEDMAALQLMARIKTEEGGKVWRCTVCDKQHFDKTRIRKHIKKCHV